MCRFDWFSVFSFTSLVLLLFICSPALAQTDPTISLSVPANSEFEEGEGNTTVTVTATISAAQTAETTVDLSLEGTAKSTDYAVVQLPDITIAAGDTVGTADLILRPVDDAFYEGPETIRIEGSSTDVTINGIDVPLSDNETLPTLEVRITQISPQTEEVREGDSVHTRIRVSLMGAATEEKETVTLTTEGSGRSTTAVSTADIDYGTNAPPWTFEVPAGGTSGQTDLRFTIVDDELQEGFEGLGMKASMSIAGTSISTEVNTNFLHIAMSDFTSLNFFTRCEGAAYAGATISCWPYVSGGETTRTYSLTMTWLDSAQSQTTTRITPSSHVFTIGSGERLDLEDLATDFTIDSGTESMNFYFSFAVSPNDQGETVSTNQLISVYPAADPTFEFSEIRLHRTWRGIRQFGNQAFQLVLLPYSPRPVEADGPMKYVEVVLDSGVALAPCSYGGGAMTCLYSVKEGDFDFDGQIEVLTGGVKFTQWRDMGDTSITGPVANPLPAQKTVFDTTGMQIYGGGAAVDLSVSPETVQEGSGEQKLTIVAQVRAARNANFEQVIPLRFTNVSTDATDYTVRGPASVTIERGQSEGRTTAIFFTPTDDLKKEDRVETLRIEGSTGQSGTAYVRGTELNILDAAGVSLSVSPTEIAEDDAATQVIVTASWGDIGDTALNRDLQVPLSWGGTAGEGDYTRSGGDTVTIPASSHSGSTMVTITPTNDNLLEGSETISISGSVPGRSVASTVISLTDDETVPAITLGVSETSLSESGAAVSVTVNATLDPTVAMANDVTTVILDLGGTATSGTDYSASWSPVSRQISIPAGETAGSNTVSLTLNPTDDAIAEGDEVIIVQGTATTDMASRNLVVKVANIVLEDDDNLGINLSPRTLTVAENETATYEVWLGTRPTGDVEISLNSTDATTTTVSINKLTFTPTTWNIRQEITVTGVNDDRNNPDDERTASIRHSASGGGYDDLETVILPITVTDDDEAATFSIADATATEGQPMSFTVSRNGAAGEAATVSWTTAEDTSGDDPAGSSDYAVQATAQTLSFAEGDISKTITVQTTEDTVDEADETFLVQLSAPSEGTSITDGTATGRITDNDATPELSISAPVAVEEGATSSTVSMTFTVNLSAASGLNVAVDYADSGEGTATTGTDYDTLIAGTLNFAPGDTSKTIVVTVNGDYTDEENETVILRLSSPVNAVFAGGVASLDSSGTITDDDTRGITVLAATSGVTVAEADDPSTPGTTENVMTYTIALESQPTGTVTINLESGDPTVATVSPASLEFTTSSYGAKTVTITGVPDAVDNQNDRRSTSITHTVDAEDTDYEDASAASVTVTVTDDDTRGITVSTSSVTVAEVDNPSTSGTTENVMTYTIALESQPTDTVTINLESSDPTVVTVSPASLEFTTSSYGAKTVTITGVPDAVDNQNDRRSTSITHTVDAEDTDYEDASAASVTVMVTDDEATPTLSLSLSPATIDERGTTNASTVTATLSHGSYETITLAISVPDGSPVTQSGSTLTIPGGETDSTATVTLTAVDNNVDAANATVVVSGTASGGAVSNPSNVTLTITDDDTRGITVSTSSVTVAEVDNPSTSGTTENVMTYTIALESQPTDTVTINLESGDPTVATVSPASLEFTTSSYGAKTVTITGVPDAVDNQNDRRSTSITHTVDAEDTDYEDASAASVTVTVTDDDTRGITVSTSSVTVAEVDNPSTSGTTENLMTYTIALESQPTDTVTINLESGDPTVATVSPASLEFTTSSYGAKTVTITGVPDAVDNQNDRRSTNITHTVDAEDTDYEDASAASVTVMVTDDEATPTLNLSLSPATIDESGATNVSTVTAELSHGSYETISIAISVPNASPVTQSGSALTILAGETHSTGTVTLTAMDNEVDAANATVIVSGTASGGGVSNPSNVTLTITDDETIGITVSTLSVTITEMDNPSTSSTNESIATYTIALDSQPSGTVVISLLSADNTVATLTPSSLEFTASSWGAKTVTITGVPDAVDNQDDRRSTSITHTVDAEDTDYEDATAASVTVIVTDDEVPPTLSLSLDPATIDESGATNVSNVTAALSHGSYETISIAISVPNASPVTQSGSTLTIPAGETDASGTVTLTAIDNNVDAANATVVVSGTASGGGVSNPPNVNLTITDDDAIGIAVSASSSGINIAEADNPDTVGSTENVRTYTIALATQPSGTVTINLASSNTDIATVMPLRLNFTASSWDAETVTVTGISDDVDNSNDRRTASISHTVVATGTDYEDETAPSVSVTVTDDETTPTLSLSLDPAAIDEKGATNRSTVTAKLNHGSYEDLTVSITIPSGSPVTQSGNSLTIVAGSTTSTGSVILAAVDNNLDAADAMVVVSGIANGGGIANPADVTLTITDDDVAPTALELTVDSDTSTDGEQTSLSEDGGAKTVRVTATLSGSTTFAVNKLVSVEVGVAGDSATEGTDYNTVSVQSITIAAGASSGHVDFTLTPIQDSLAESSETITLDGTLSGVTVTDATITLTDDDSAPTSLTLSVDADAGTNNVQTSVDEGGGAKTVRITATLGGSSTFTQSKTVTVEVGVAGDSATEGTDYNTVATQSITIAAGSSSGHIDFKLTPIQDALVESEETISLSGTMSGVTVNGAEITLADDDMADAFSVADGSATEGQVVSFEVTRSGSGTGTASVSWRTDHDTQGNHPASTSDYTPKSLVQTLVFVDGEISKTISIQTTHDTQEEGSETFLVILSSPSDGTVIADGSAVGTILDDDLAPSRVRFQSATSSMEETTYTTSYNIPVYVKDLEHLRLYMEIAGGTATEGVDYKVLSDPWSCVVYGRRNGKWPDSNGPLDTGSNYNLCRLRFKPVIDRICEYDETVEIRMSRVENSTGDDVTSTHIGNRTIIHTLTLRDGLRPNAPASSYARQKCKESGVDWTRSKPPERLSSSDSQESTQIACVDDAKWKLVERYYKINSEKAPNFGRNWYRVLLAYQNEYPDAELPTWKQQSNRPTTPFTAAEARISEKKWLGTNSGSLRVPGRKNGNHSIGNSCYISRRFLSG